MIPFVRSVTRLGKHPHRVQLRAAKHAQTVASALGLTTVWALPRIKFDFTPLSPDPDEARELVLDELSKLKYQLTDSLWEQFLKWLSDILSGLFRFEEGTLSTSETVVFLLLILGIIALLGFASYFALRWRRLRDSKAAGTTSQATLFLNDARSAAQLAAAADRAEQDGDWNTAVVERFRAIIRELDERRMIALRPGLTAFEATKLATQACGQDELFFNCARWFNDIYYGSATADTSAISLTARLAEFVRSFTSTRSNANIRSTTRQSQEELHSERQGGGR